MCPVAMADKAAKLPEGIAYKHPHSKPDRAVSVFCFIKILNNLAESQA